MSKTNTPTSRARTYARNRNSSNELISRKGREKKYERDSTFFLKLVVFIILSVLWLRLQTPIAVGPFMIQGIPIGLIIALLLVFWIEQYQFNRKIWYAVLIMMAIFSSLTPLGIMI